MPSYRYHCSKCDCFVEVIRSISAEESIPDCPHCKQSMSRVYESTPVHLKGTGFYKTGG